MKILVTGANGLLGRAVTSLLRDRGHVIFGLVRNYPVMPVADITYIEVNLTENFEDTLTKHISEELDCIIHLAQSSQFKNYPGGLNDLYSVNVHATFKLLEFARKKGIKQFILASTGGVYETRRMPASENANLEKPEDLTPYLGSKLCAEAISQNYTREFYVTIIRPFFLYGAFQKRFMLLPRLYDNIKGGKQIFLDGKQ